MIGKIDREGRALLPIRLRASPQATPTVVDAWIDTGFTGDLVLGQAVVAQLGLVRGLTIRALLADGSEVSLDTLTCQIEWFGTWTEVEVILNSGQFPLLGVNLLRGRILLADYAANSLTLS